VVVGDVGGIRGASDGLLVSHSHCRVAYRHGRILGGDSFCGAGRVVCGDVLGCGEAGGCLCGVARLRIGEVKVPSTRVESCVEVSEAQGSSLWSLASSGSGSAASVRMAS
jgi:hypothetical protein